MYTLQRLMRALFSVLYHELAGMYDAVAAVVSLGAWNSWVHTVMPHLAGQPILELGPGPGHLQLSLQQGHFETYGLDESRQMLKIARRHLSTPEAAPANLVRGTCERLPFGTASFGTVVSTFPAPAVLQPSSLAEIRRVLHQDGAFVVLPMAWPSGRHFLARLTRWLFRLTGEALASFQEASGRFAARLAETGFRVEAHRVDLQTGTVLILVARSSA